jgi:hypothetical protein
MDHVAIFAVHRNEVSWPHQLMKRTQFALACVTRCVHWFVARVNHLGSRAMQIVNDATDGPFIAWYWV